ncbi:trypsin-like serine peptidase [Fibrivirga algicola]|uniref:Trypsin-like peptidase domain-containing protein n=1 Tax=Fibrivirga algicola TaxID=2950420 RepID=A0ABX0QGG8_9BACT|nr:serine protease [Fibrivirga algicola]NID11266.1 trypsin-like peptidase domain-containing protein [Fibrivirga algicola]
MLGIEQIIRTLRVSRGEFATLFLQAQVGLPTRMNFEAVAQSAVGDDAFKLGLLYAQSAGFLPQLLRCIVDDQREDGTLAKALLVESGKQSAELQAMVDLAQGFGLPKALYYGLFNGMKWACKLHIDGKQKGTGILVGPNLVLTAWHVVRQLFRPDPANPHQQLADEQASDRLQVEFDNYEGFRNGTLSLRPSKTVLIDAHRQWLVSFKTCHQQELMDLLPPELTELNNCWDYAIIRLARPIGSERRWARLDPNAVVPRLGQRVMIFQHPAGASLKIDQGAIAAPVIANPAVFPGIRFLHRVNALGGSSGGPCFDQDFMLFGLHQGAWPTNPGDPVLNRGVPLSGIQAHIKETIGELPAPDPADSPIWSLGEVDGFLPVLGCDAFQATIWQSVLSGRPRLFTTDGLAGSGKTFRARVLSTMLPVSGHLVMRLDGQLVSKFSATELVAAIAGQVGQPVPVFTSQTDMNTTSAAWLRAEVLPKLLEMLEQARQKRLVWLVLTDLNKYNIDGPQATDFLALLYEQILTLDWLRVFLDGMRGDIPQQLVPFLTTVTTDPITRADLATYFRKFLAQRNMVVDDLNINAATLRLEKNYTQARNRTPETATVSLSLAVMERIEDIVMAAQETI